MLCSWAGIICDNYRTSDDWKHRAKYRKQRDKCVSAAIKELGKKYKALISKFTFDKAERVDQVKRLSVVLNILWLRRDSEKSRFIIRLNVNFLSNIWQWSTKKWWVSRKKWIKIWNKSLPIGKDSINSSPCQLSISTIVSYEHEACECSARSRGSLGYDVVFRLRAVWSTFIRDLLVEVFKFCTLKIKSRLEKCQRWHSRTALLTVVDVFLARKTSTSIIIR